MLESQASRKTYPNQFLLHKIKISSSSLVIHSLIIMDEAGEGASPHLAYRRRENNVREPNKTNTSTR